MTGLPFLLPLPTSRLPGLSVSCVCLGALPCSGQMGACLCLCAPDLCLTRSVVCTYNCLFPHMSTLVLSLCLCFLWVFAVCCHAVGIFSHFMGLCVSLLSLCSLYSASVCVCVCFYVQSLSHLHPPSFSKFRRKTSKHLSISIPNLFSSSCGWAEEGARRVPRVAGIWVEVVFRAGLEEPCGDGSRGGGAWDKS